MRTGLVVFFLLSTLCFGQDFANDSSGFERQYRPAFDAATSGNRDQIRGALDTFMLPDEWFQQTFGAAADEWRRQYNAEFNYFEYAESRRIQDEFKGSVPVMEVNILPPQSSLNPPPKPAPVSLQPLPEMEGVEIKIFRGQSDSLSASGMNTFVYVNGIFRFFGLGAYPFWDPRRIHRSDTCDPQGRQPGGHLTAPVTPIYPDEAKNNQVQGMVNLLLNVAKDGSVQSVDVLDGDPLLAQSATAAAKQWHYQPFINCGEPMEAQDVENVRYALDGSTPNVTIIPPSMKIRVSSGVADRNAVHKVNPKYPPEAKHAGIQGVVVLKMQIDKEGKPHDIAVVSGPPKLVDAALNAVRQWRYHPYVLNGEPVEVETTVQINFVLHR